MFSFYTVPPSVNNSHPARVMKASGSRLRYHPLALNKVMDPVRATGLYRKTQFSVIPYPLVWVWDYAELRDYSFL
jgi:hypothetical protein